MIRQEISDYRVGRGESERAAYIRRTPVDLMCRIHLVENIARHLQEFASIIGQLHPMCPPFEQRGAQNFLKFANGSGDRRLRNRQQFRRPAHLPGFRRRNEVLQLPKIYQFSKTQIARMQQYLKIR